MQDPIDCSLLLAQADEGLSLEIEEVLLREHGASRNVAAAQHGGEHRAEVLVVLAQVAALAHAVNTHLERGDPG